MDFSHEQRNIEQFDSNFQDDETVHFPDVYPAYCTKRILTMERLQGIPGTNDEAMRLSGQDLNEFARRGANMYLNMIFRDGFYHADPHPGNLMLMRDNVVGVMDCGMVGRLNEDLREDVEAMLLAASRKDAQELADIVLRIGSPPADCKRDELRTDVADYLTDFIGESLADFDLSGALNGLISIISRYHILLPAPLSMLLKVLVMLEGTSQRLDRNFSLAELMRPYYLRSARRRLAPGRIMRRLQKSLRDWERLLDSLPRDLSDIVTRLRSGAFHVHLEHHRLETTVNRLVMGILTAALFLGSSELWSRQAPPLIWGISVFGAMGYIVSVWLGLRLILAVRKTGSLQTKDKDR
jgi:ubiquinone biosynthesis protein